MSFAAATLAPAMILYTITMSFAEASLSSCKDTMHLAGAKIMRVSLGEILMSLTTRESMTFKFCKDLLR